ncbi:MULTISPECIES: sensor histidine kinase [unclassified Flavobacterium]|uniref:sensor histidine kinase n=1 Tax=unclassified Flavobacterium TaxID=196869 RepID=UPI0012A862F7|nr:MULTISPECIES: histidine kinase [unclassified Flavobacterium]MBF4486417.1 histidine kinase [Flavobacterium sp. CSZ]QGK72544.1 GHKL domain-containing protein [Flavobacterium sp. SLB02]
MITIHKNRHWIFLVFFWSLLGITIWAQMIEEYNFWSATTQAVLVLLCSTFLAHFLSDVILPKALRKNKMNWFAVQSVIVVLLLSFCLALIYTIFSDVGSRGRLYHDEDHLNSIQFLWVRFWGSIPAAILINGTACGLRFYQEHSVIEKDHAQLQQVHLEAQIKILQDQINPHLMFNVLNHIHILMQSDVKLASVLLVQFSDILRYQLYECNKEYVPLHLEIKYLKDLIAVEETRWGNELEVKSKWNIEDGQLQIVPLLLVPLIENAFKHVSRLPNQRGYVHLSCEQSNSQLYFKIENSHTEQYKIPSKSQGLGLENVKKRLAIQYPEKHQLNINKTDSDFIVTVVLDLK